MSVPWVCVSFGLSPDKAACDSWDRDPRSEGTDCSVTRESHAAQKFTKVKSHKKYLKNKLITSWQRSINSAMKWRGRHMWLYVSSRITHESHILFFIAFVCASLSHEVLRWDSVLWTYAWVHDCTKKSFRKSAQLSEESRQLLNMFMFKVFLLFVVVIWSRSLCCGKNG